VAEPWFLAAKAVALPPAWLWFRWRFEHLERIPARGPALIACNHASYLDPIANAYAVVKAGRRPRFLAKDDLFEIPIVGRALAGAGQIPVSRGSGDRTPLATAERALASGEIVLVYPEGTASRDPDLWPMVGKTGAARLALTTGAPVIPVAHWGAQVILPYGSKKPHLVPRHLVKMLAGPEYKVRTRNGYTAPKPPPVHPELEFTITDADQRFVDLSASDLVVVEDGVEQKIDAFHEAVAPVSIVLALDESGSMRRSAAAVLEAAHQFIDALRPEDSLAPMLFADQVFFEHDLTKDRDAARKAIDGYIATGGTALYDALSDALVRLKRIEGRRAVVILTDGRDENNPGTGPGSVRNLDDVLALAKETDAAIFSIGLGTKVDKPPLERLARLSGGQAYFPLDVSDLQEQYRRIVENMRRRYVLSYTSTNIVRNGAWREVQIRPKTEEIVVTSRGGYFAPEH